MIKLIHKIIFVFFIFLSVEIKSKEVGIGDVNSKVTIKVFSSLTCPACANFHSKILLIYILHVLQVLELFDV